MLTSNPSLPQRKHQQELQQGDEQDGNMEPQQGDGQDGHLELSLREEEELRLPGEAVDLQDPQFRKENNLQPTGIPSHQLIGYLLALK